MKCCAECFGDRGIRKSLIPLFSTAMGDCPYCETRDTALLVPANLAEYFQLLVSAYQRDASGRLLVQWFRKDWGIFDHERMDDLRAKDLLAEILDDGEVVRQPFIPIDSGEIDRLIEWERLREELRYQNRFFPNFNIDLERLELLLSHLTIDTNEVPVVWHRARIQPGDNILNIDQMGAPPKRIASHGRANPAGIPYLYLASNPQTAISEIRPHVGQTACVADFTIPETVKLVDLRQPRKMVSPFLLADARDIGRMRSDLPFLERLGEELTRPVVPEAAAIDYTPSQYLCEFIKKCGYSGVVYRSSISDGMNLALFNPQTAAVGTVTQRSVIRVTVELGIPPTEVADTVFHP